MGSVLASTTKAQVSGHKFLTRRVEHGVVLGDVRMIADPLGARRRAVLFGLIGTAIIAAGAGVLAVFQPAVDPGEANIIKLDNGALYVRLPDGKDSALHPVVNEASARLIVGKPEPAAKASPSVLDGVPRGVPVGLVDAPGQIAPHPQPGQEWSAAQEGKTITVVAGAAPAPLPEGQGILARVDGRLWVVTAHGRAELPAEDTAVGRSIRRRLDITVDTPVWEPPARLLSAVHELPPYRPVEGTVLSVGQEYWLEKSGALLPLTQLQALIALDCGLPTKQESAVAMNEYPAAVRQVAELPLQTLKWQQPDKVWVRGDGKVAVGAEIPTGVALSGNAVATQYAGAHVGATGVDTGHGTVVVTDYGKVHRVRTPADAEALGIVGPQPAPWSILGLLPEGQELSRENALRGRI